ncbi:hypothetical protein PsYK624_145850 [Phanerochaete sordida]|uniref:Uncharacterized protein n=1 Tax=Phanerochaete sordida TaxID=48140 RepID=A0A9P3GP95_9APHY|nr:hypothetical protein PsYK624_145850 [Phanerochaete sordida]
MRLVYLIDPDPVCYSLRPMLHPLVRISPFSHSASATASQPEVQRLSQSPYILGVLETTAPHSSLSSPTSPTACLGARPLPPCPVRRLRAWGSCERSDTATAHSTYTLYIPRSSYQIASAKRRRGARFPGSSREHARR